MDPGQTVSAPDGGARPPVSAGWMAQSRGPQPELGRAGDMIKWRPSAHCGWTPQLVKSPPAGVPAPAGTGIKLEHVISGACTSEMTPLTQDRTTFPRGIKAYLACLLRKAALPLFDCGVHPHTADGRLRLLCHACEPVQELLLLHREHPPPVQPQLTDPRVAAVHKVADQPLPS